MARHARYDQVADFYVAEVGDSTGDAGTAGLLELVRVRSGSRLIDIACGQGRVSRELARRGAVVTGIDLSTALIQRARLAEQKDPLGIEYVVADACRVSGLESASFDGVVCNYGLSDIDDLEGTLDMIRRLLRPEGFFVFSILHPCFPGWREKASSSWPPGQGYFREGWWRTEVGSSRIRRRVGANHRTMSTYLNALVRYGLVVDTVLEPPPPQEWLDASPLCDPVPTFLVLRCTTAARWR